jgi:plasmid stability protein
MLDGAFAGSRYHQNQEASVMPVVHIRDVSRATLERLKARARRNDRSLQAELKGILEEAAGTAWSVTRASATKLRKTLARRAHSDSADLIALDRRAR